MPRLCGFTARRLAAHFAHKLQQSVAARKRLLFLSPCVPSPRRGGPAQRAYHVLRALARDHDVSLLVIDLHERWFGHSDLMPDGLASAIRIRVRATTRPGLFGRLAFQQFAPRLFHRLMTVPPEWRYADPGLLREAVRAVDAVQFDVLHVFRLYMEPFAAACRARSDLAWVQMDIDEVESLVRERDAALLLDNGHASLANSKLMDAAAYAAVEATVLPRYDRLYLSSEVECCRLLKKIPGLSVSTLPNIVDLPDPSPAKGSARAQFKMLFVGSLSYYANRDAIRYFVRQVLPLIRQRSRRETEFHIVGSNALPADVADWKSVADVRYQGAVAELGGYYADADVVVVPLRTGGGTRIKILEAFGYRTPVVSTQLGAEGIRAVNGEHLLLADTPEEFAAACVRLSDDSALADCLAGAGLRLQQHHYSPAAIREALSARE